MSKNCFLQFSVKGKIRNKYFSRKLGNFKKIAEMLGFDGEYQVVHRKAKFCLFWVKNYIKTGVKDSIEKPILLNLFDYNLLSKIVLYR